MDQKELTETAPRLLAPSSEEVARLKADPTVTKVDSIPEAMIDLFKIRFPFVAPGSPEYKKTLAAYEAEEWNEARIEERTVWAYFPWKRTMVRLPKEEDFYALRTARNKFLITSEEQDLFYNARIGLGGLSVGTSVLNTIVLSGGGRNWRIADFDTLSITNMNRLPSSVCDLETEKIVAASRRAYETNPFSNLELFNRGLREEDFDAFFGTDDSSKLAVFIEEMDSIQMKIVSRYKARELGIPVVMATDNGDNTIVDVERFDLEPDRPLFHGWVPDELLRSVNAEIPMSEKVKLANTIVGPDVTPRMQFSLTQVGQTLPSWPQLGNAATVSGAATSYVVRRILTGENMPSGRYFVNFDELIDPDYHTEAARAERAARKEEFILGFKLVYEEGA